MQRDFTATGPDRPWVGDFTYLCSREGVSYFSFVIDAFSRKALGRQPTSHMRTDLVLDALRMALGQRAPGNAMAESFVDTFKTELIADRVWRSRSQLEPAVVEYVSWFNNEDWRTNQRNGSTKTRIALSRRPAAFEAVSQVRLIPVVTGGSLWAMRGNEMSRSSFCSRELGSPSRDIWVSRHRRLSPTTGADP